MTNGQIVNFGKFLVSQKPLCLSLPFYKELVNHNLYYKLAERSERDFQGRNMFEQICPKATICDAKCMGRPVPMYPELEHIIQKYNPSIGLWNNIPVWLLSIDTCTTCPFVAQCTKVCPSMGAFTDRNKSTEDYYVESSSDLEILSEQWMEKLYLAEEEEGWIDRMKLTADDIAWDALTEPQKAAIVLVQIKGLSFEQAANKLGIYKRSVQKSLESGMETLKEYGLARRALKNDRTCKFSIAFYENLNNIEGIAMTHSVSKGLINRKLNEFRSKYDLST